MRDVVEQLAREGVVHRAEEGVRSNCVPCIIPKSFEKVSPITGCTRLHVWIPRPPNFGLSQWEVDWGIPPH